MANSDAPMGFELFRDGGHEAIRRKRVVDVDNAAPLAPGDAYTIEADGNITRCNGSTQPNGIVEGLELQGVDEGPVSRAYLPALTAGTIIGIEDASCTFRVQTNAAIIATEFDAGALVDVVDAAPHVLLAQSRQEVGDVGGSQLRLVSVIDTPLNEPYIINAKVEVALVPANVQA